MADSIGQLCDKLNTCSLRMWWAQENIYQIRHMTFEQFKDNFFQDDEGAKKLWEYISKACDINLQRNALISEIDSKLLEIVKAAVEGEDLDNGSYIQKQHKTY